MTTQAIVTVKSFGRESLDKNGKQAVILLPVAGKIPNRNIISGTVAEREGFVVGHSYLVSVRETEANKYGRQFSWSNVQEMVSALDTIKATKELGEGSIYSVEGAGATQTATTTATADSLGVS